MEWLLLAGLGIIWAVFLLPSGVGRSSPATSVDEFEKSMGLLAGTEAEGRWVITPQKGAEFTGAKARYRARILERRRMVLTFLVEATGITFLMGLIQPLRAMWVLTSGCAVVLFGYCWLLVRIKTIGTGYHGIAAQRAEDHRVGAVIRKGHSSGQRYVTDRSGKVARTTYGGLATFSEEDVHVVLRRSE